MNTSKLDQDNLKLKKKKSAFTFKKKDHQQRCSLKGCEMNDKNQVGMRVNNASMV